MRPAQHRKPEKRIRHRANYAVYRRVGLQLRRDAILLRAGYATAVALGAGTYLIGLGLTATVGVVVAAVLLTRSAIYLHYERYLAFRSFEDFASGKIRHECIACGASCHLKVNLGKDDVERLLRYAKEKGIQDTIIETHGKQLLVEEKTIRRMRLPDLRR